jgi:stage V sporulation protein SpoVS
VQQALTEIGEGPIEVGLVVKDLDQTRAYLTQQGIDFVAAPDTLHIVSQETVGVRFFLKAIS